MNSKNKNQKILKQKQKRKKIFWQRYLVNPSNPSIKRRMIGRLVVIQKNSNISFKKQKTNNKKLSSLNNLNFGCIVMVGGDVRCERKKIKNSKQNSQQMKNKIFVFFFLVSFLVLIVKVFNIKNYSSLLLFVSCVSLTLSALSMTSFSLVLVSTVRNKSIEKT